eukprot:TRINITY_DN2071_c1_g2_i1.p1 TRINITY_DN2071_c1_g2~~TRINITY_DN2071_c1_g2_i1.p1  ORF type:complete len:887 (+),score=128.68 TRINITY_DN2071_c1_g2_i1:73-2733(+)
MRAAAVCAALAALPPAARPQQICPPIPAPGSGTDSVFSAVNRLPEAATFASFVSLARLQQQSEVNMTQEKTLLVPLERAWNAWPRGVLSMLQYARADTDLRTVLAYHVFPRALPNCSIRGHMIELTVLGENLTLNASGQLSVGPTGTEAAIVRADMAQGVDGFVHGIDAVLVPPALTLPALSLLDAAEAAGYTTFVSAVAWAGLTANLTNPAGDLTCFVPTNAAFTTAQVRAALRDPVTLRQLLLYHCSAGYYTAAAAAASPVVQPLSGSPALVLSPGVNGSILVGPTGAEARSATVDVFSTTGVFHGVDAMLIPAGLDLPSDARRTLTLHVRVYGNSFCAGAPTATGTWTAFSDTSCRPLSPSGTFRMTAEGCTAGAAEWQLELMEDTGCTKRLQNTGAARGVVGACLYLSHNASAIISSTGATAHAGGELCSISQWLAVYAPVATVRTVTYAGTSCLGTPVENSSQRLESATGRAPIVCTGAEGPTCSSDGCCTDCDGTTWRSWTAAGFGVGGNGAMTYCVQQHSYGERDCLFLAQGASPNGSSVAFGTCQPFSAPPNAAAHTEGNCTTACARDRPAIAAACGWTAGGCRVQLSAVRTLEGAPLSSLRPVLCVASRFRGSGRYDWQAPCGNPSAYACDPAEAAAAEQQVNRIERPPSGSPTSPPSSAGVAPTEEAAAASGSGSAGEDTSGRVPPWAMVAFGLSIGICAICLVQCSQRNRSKLAAVGDGARNVVHHEARPTLQRQLLEGEATEEKDNEEPSFLGLTKHTDDVSGNADSGLVLPSPTGPLADTAGRGGAGRGRTLQATAPVAGWQMGEEVRVCSLRSRPQLNDARGQIVGFQAGMVVVDLGEHGTKALRPRNLLPAVKPPAPAGGGTAQHLRFDVP